MQTINLLASARPNLGGQGEGSVSGGGTTGGVGEDNCAGRGDDAKDGRRQGREEDGAAAAEPRRLGRTARWRRSPGGHGGHGRSGRKPPAFRGLTVADRRCGGGEGVGGFREAAGGGESRGADDGGAAEAAIG
jgi:hypothetical protein